MVADGLTQKSPFSYVFWNWKKLGAMAIYFCTWWILKVVWDVQGQKEIPERIQNTVKHLKQSFSILGTPTPLKRQAVWVFSNFLKKGGAQNFHIKRGGVGKIVGCSKNGGITK